MGWVGIKTADRYCYRRIECLLHHLTQDLGDAVGEDRVRAPRCGHERDCALQGRPAIGRATMPEPDMPARTTL